MGLMPSEIMNEPARNINVLMHVLELQAEKGRKESATENASALMSVWSQKQAEEKRKKDVAEVEERKKNLLNGD